MFSLQGIRYRSVFRCRFGVQVSSNPPRLQGSTPLSLGMSSSHLCLFRSRFSAAASLSYVREAVRMLSALAVQFLLPPTNIQKSLVQIAPEYQLSEA